MDDPKFLLVKSERKMISYWSVLSPKEANRLKHIILLKIGGLSDRKFGTFYSISQAIQEFRLLVTDRKEKTSIESLS
jgi:hypothetical protein